MNGSMMQQPLLISTLLTHAERHHGSQQIVSRRVEGSPGCRDALDQPAPSRRAKFNTRGRTRAQIARISP